MRTFRLKDFGLAALLSCTCIATLPARAERRARDVAGTYAGTCITRYKDAQPGRCLETLSVEFNNSVLMPGDAGCLSPQTFYGLLAGDSARLQAQGWQAQPRGQVLDLDFRYRAGRWTATGSGYGLSDSNYRYDCSFTQR